MARAQTCVPREVFRFLAELADHNERDWFNANKERYHEQVRDPLLAFVSAFAPHLARISPYLVADPRPVGGKADGGRLPNHGEGLEYSGIRAAETPDE